MVPQIRALEQAAPDWLWSPRDHWSRYKGFGRISLFIGGVLLFVGLVLYGVGLLGMRMALERRRKQEDGDGA